MGNIVPVIIPSASPIVASLAGWVVTTTFTGTKFTSGKASLIVGIISVTLSREYVRYIVLHPSGNCSEIGTAEKIN
jgi:hypothetical protein